MAKKFEFNVSVGSINKVVEDLEKYKAQLEATKAEIHLRLAEYAYKQVMSYVPVEEGDLAISIHFYGNDVIAKVYTSNPHAAFVEFGTGGIGKDSKHPEADKQGWQYDTHNHGLTGWWYYKDGELHWTRGQVGQKFMYQAYLDVQREANRIVKEVLQERGLL